MTQSDNPIPAASEPGRVSVTYLAGISFCGSTLLALLLDTHPDIVSIGEMGPARGSAGLDYVCSCGKRVVECDFFADVGRRMREGGVDFDPADMRLRHNDSDDLWSRLAAKTFGVPGLDAARDALLRWSPGPSRRLAEYRRRNVAFIRAALAVSGARVFFDATKHAARIPFLVDACVDLRVVHLVRDPRGYVHSARKHDGWTVERAAREFVRGHGEIEYLMKRLPPERTMRIRYRDICTDPDRSLADLTAFMGVAPMEAPDDFWTAEHHVIGNAMRRRTEGRIRMDESWRDTLSEADLHAVSRVAGPLARRYGYDL